MEKVARLAPVERNELFSETASELSITPAVVEKDFWVTWVLKKLFEDAELAPLFMFKGGTSLSKVYGLIQRFSEDIDLVLDWRQVTEEDPLARRSNTQQDRFNKTTVRATEDWVAEKLYPALQKLLGDIVTCSVNEEKRSNVSIDYPAAFPDDYLRPQVLLEIGALSAWMPSELKRIRSYAAEKFPQIFEQPTCEVRVISAKRTFWDKATLLHNETCRPADKHQNKGYSRHYYDIVKLADSQVKREALVDLKLLTDVVAYKKQFFCHSWSRYDLARPGSFRLVPVDHVLNAVSRDYHAMSNMFFGKAPSMEEILQVLRGLEIEINQLKTDQ
jgi:hypothetical protein